jgi:hypothetical protein
VDIDDVFSVLLDARSTGAHVSARLTPDVWVNGPVMQLDGRRAVIGGRGVAVEYIADVAIVGRDDDHEVTDELLDAGKALRDMSNLTLAEQMIERVKNRVK